MLFCLIIFQVPAIAAYVICAFFGFQVLIGIIKVKKLDERERLITGTAWTICKLTSSIIVKGNVISSFYFS